MITKTIDLYLNTLRYLKPVQLYGRIWFYLCHPRAVPDESPPLRTLASTPASWALRPSSMIGRNSFRFLNENGSLTNGWEPHDKSLLWRYNLHYFNDLNAADAENRRSWHRSLIDSWIEENPPGLGSGWQPYPLSLRIVNWIKWFLKGNDPSIGWLKSLAFQVRYLSKRMEYHLLGNHLFANLKALVFAGFFFQGAESEKWIGKGIFGIQKELSEQILCDGGHFERSPMYHAVILEDVLDLINIVYAFHVDLSKELFLLERFLCETAERMFQWMVHLIHPDGKIALFNDAAFQIGVDFKALKKYGRALSVSVPDTSMRPLVHLPETGYIRFNESNYTVILDVAPIGPDHLPAHGHADTLSFELSYEDCRVIVDSGTSCYGNSDERLRQRSTAAHNTIEIDGQNSSEIWNGFRVARRAYPKNLAVKNGDGFIEINCSHDGYCRLPGRPVHNRTWRLGAKQFVVSDSIGGYFSKAISRFHFHPDVRAHQTGRSEGRLNLPDGKKLLWRVYGGRAAIKPSTYHPEFGMSLVNQCLEVILDGNSCEIKFILI